MKSYFSPVSFIFLFVIGLVFHSQAAVGASTQSPLTAAVFDFEVSEGIPGDRGSEISALLYADLSGSENLFLVEREQLDAIFAEQELGLAGNVSAQTAAAVGQLTGAQVLVTGRMFEAGNRFFIVARIISAETGRVIAEKVSFEKIGALEPAIGELGEKLNNSVGENADVLVADVESYEEMLERFRGLVPSGDLPSVSVDVVEEHIRMQVIDPAVETEMKKVLIALGFEVINQDASTSPADIAITGEAFSEMAGRRGGLVSCRSRIEVEVVSVEEGKLLLADRQVSVAVDVAEAIAGKLALENGTLVLLEHILPILNEQ
ncbi:CsgG/HfaB family protein [Puniceicoccus vermicola]|uniref:Curli assembly protein CsgG n=1 Tax=Puniceicoccus vermicola TaxID=388746 RepID=A0A7X1B033_9BACT|nr:CsgG/HfaB family protein [Puniceicoccus vermicola]MBC2602979.1 curli assembly protein CsgG [Puniceicoccus vermicola]